MYVYRNHIGANARHIVSKCLVFSLRQNSSSHGPLTSLTRYVKLWVAHAPGMPGTFSPPPRVSDPDMHHGTCVTHVPWCMPGSLTSGFLRTWWRGKRSRHSRHTSAISMSTLVNDRNAIIFDTLSIKINATKVMWCNYHWILNHVVFECWQTGEMGFKIFPSHRIM